MSTPDKPPRRRIAGEAAPGSAPVSKKSIKKKLGNPICLLYTSDAADE